MAQMLCFLPAIIMLQQFAIKLHHRIMMICLNNCQETQYSDFSIEMFCYHGGIMYCYEIIILKVKKHPSMPYV